MDVSDQELKLRLRLAQIEKNEACQEDFLIFVKSTFRQLIPPSSVTCIIPSSVPAYINPSFFGDSDKEVIVL